MNIVCWNCNSIKYKYIELANFMYNQKCDVVGLNETKLDGKFRLKIPDYKIFRNDRDSSGGGVALLIHNNINCELIDLNFKNIESIAVKIKTDDGEIKIICLYIPPKKELCKRDLFTLRQLKGKYILMGDFNARHTAWNCISNNKRGIELLKYCLDKNITINAPKEPTHYPKRGAPSILDLFLCKNIPNCSAAVSICALSSDHNPIGITINENATRTVVEKMYDFSKADWKLFQEYINNNIKLNCKIEKQVDIDKFVNEFTQIMNEAVTMAVPTRKIENRDNLPKEILDLISKKNSFRRKFQKTRDYKYKVTMDALVVIIGRKIAEFRNSKLKSKLTHLKIGDLWKLTKSRKRQHFQVPPLLNDNKEYVFSDSNKNNLLAKKYEEVFVRNLNLGSVNHRKHVLETVKKFLNEKQNDNYDVRLTTPREIIRLLKKFKNKKAPGEDKITYLMLKKLPKKGIIFLTKLINKIMLLGYFPDAWKIAKIIVLLKPNKNPTLPSSYRPISLLPHLSKLVEKVLNKRLLKFMNSNGILMREQFGFRRGHNTQMQLARLANHITREFNNNKHTGAIFLDIEKAFDTAWHAGIIYKLVKYKFPRYLIVIIASYLKNRKMYVFNNNVKSRIVSVVAGVPQGSVLGPQLYNLYINDLPTTKDVEISLFADDTGLYTSSYKVSAIKNKLQNASKKIVKFFNKWKTTVNIEKTETIIFTKRRPKLKPEISFSNNNLPWVSNVKYLGINLDSKLNFTLHTKEIVDKGIAALVTLYPLINKKSYINVKNKLQIYKTIVRPMLTYGCPIWNMTCASNYQKLQILQNKFLRLVGNYPRYTPIHQLHDELKIEYISAYVKHITKRFYSSKNVCENSLLDDLQYTNLHYKHKRLKHNLN